MYNWNKDILTGTGTRACCLPKTSLNPKTKNTHHTSCQLLVTLAHSKAFCVEDIWISVSGGIGGCRFSDQNLCPHLFHVHLPHLSLRMSGMPCSCSLHTVTSDRKAAEVEIHLRHEVEGLHLRHEVKGLGV